ncbi:exosortase X [Pontibacter harenae]|uniref:exosortase X n=1 Tax=Pontibacter harenae TaxID=2894083 RepID=UPI001E44B0BE|nr:archaeosortase/exosortase family protein [Pontibacter harenae]MCC9167199.1 archaeosortase/exosortase family protein [Pontibacter harenae]
MKEYKPLANFIIKTLGLCLGWFFLYDFWLTNFDNWLTLKVADASSFLLSLIGYSAETRNSAVAINGQELVYIGAPCNGMVLMALFTGFIIAYPGPLLKKLIYVPFGLAVINCLNITRVAALALNALYSSQTLEFNHNYTFTFFVYSIIFLLWMFWVKKYSTNSNNATTTIYP